MNSMLDLDILGFYIFSVTIEAKVVDFTNQ